jgi:hypothetical protein
MATDPPNADVDSSGANTLVKRRPAAIGEGDLSHIGPPASTKPALRPSAPIQRAEAQVLVLNAKLQVYALATAGGLSILSLAGAVVIGALQGPSGLCLALFFLCAFFGGGAMAIGSSRVSLRELGGYAKSLREAIHGS